MERDEVRSGQSQVQFSVPHLLLLFLCECSSVISNNAARYNQGFVVFKVLLSLVSVTTTDPHNSPLARLPKGTLFAPQNFA